MEQRCAQGNRHAPGVHVDDCGRQGRWLQVHRALPPYATIADDAAEDVRVCGAQSGGIINRFDLGISFRR
jgi:hypothetical protein